MKGLLENRWPIYGCNRGHIIVRVTLFCSSGCLRLIERFSCQMEVDLFDVGKHFGLEIPNATTHLGSRLTARWIQPERSVGSAGSGDAPPNLDRASSPLRSLPAGE